MSDLNTNYGTYEATVVNNNDPLQQGRLVLQVPQVLGTALSNWAIPSVPALTIPKVAERVWVHFAGGDTKRPIYAASGGGIQVGDTTDGFTVLPTGIHAYHNGVETFNLDTQGNVTMVGKFQTGITGARVEMIAYNPSSPGSFDGNTVNFYTGSTSESTPAQIYNAEYTSSSIGPLLSLTPGIYHGVSSTDRSFIDMYGPTTGIPGEIIAFSAEIDLVADLTWVYGRSGTGSGSLVVQTASATLNPSGTTTITGHDFVYNGAGAFDVTTSAGNQVAINASGTLFLYGSQTYIRGSSLTQIIDNYNSFTFTTHDVGTNNNPVIQGGNHSLLKFAIRSGTPEVQSRVSGDTAYGQFTAVNFLTTSARRFKTDITPWDESALDLVNATKIYSYRKQIGTAKDKTTKIFSERLHYGPVLDEMPSHVVVDDETFDISSVLGLLWKAVQELDAKTRTKK